MGAGASTAATTGDSSGGTKRAVLICHSSQERALRSRLARLELDSVEPLAIVTESFPCDVQARADVLARVSVAVLAVDAAFQRSARLVETVSFLKDARCDVLAGPLTFHSRPSGAIGAICFALGVWEPELFSSEHYAKATVGTLEFLTAAEAENVVASTRSDVEMAAIAAQDHDFAASSTRSVSASVLYVFAGADGECVASTFAALDYTRACSTATAIELCASETPEHDLAALARAHVAAFVITDASMRDAHFRRLFEAAVRWRIPILPINGATTRMTGWLAMCMAGRLWYQVALDALEQIHTPYAELLNCACKVHDSCLAIDFLQCLSGLLTDGLTSSSLTTSHDGEDSSEQWQAREDARIKLCRERACVAGALNRESVNALCATVCDLVSAFSSVIDEGEDELARAETRAHARQQLEGLGVAMDAAALAAQVLEEERAGQALAPSPNELLPVCNDGQHALSMVHYEVTRTGVFVPVPRVLDANGVPLPNLELDAMFSYQWGSQQRVLDVHHQGQVHRLRAWFDVFGHMQGNVNTAMATAVEHVACVVVFLTRAYVQSVNCRLEFQYARARGKPMVFAFLEDPRALVPELPDWVTDAAGTRAFNVYPSVVVDDSDSERECAPSRVLALDLTCDAFRGVAMLAVLLSAIRQLAAARHRGEPRTLADGSLLLCATTRALRHAVAASVSGVGTVDASASGATCTRCGVAFDPDVESTLHGCRRHAAYYMGGTLLAGRWVCCHEPRTDGAGCEATHHITVPRAWTQDPSYGTHSWQPA